MVIPTLVIIASGSVAIAVSVSSCPGTGKLGFWRGFAGIAIAPK